MSKLAHSSTAFMLLIEAKNLYNNGDLTDEMEAEIISDFGPEHFGFTKESWANAIRAIKKSSSVSPCNSQY